MDLSWLLACVIGIGTALVELLSRYRDEPFKVIAQTQFAWVYLALNGVLALGAHWVLLSTSWGGDDAEAIDRAGLALASGLGAAVILRSRVFTAQLGDEQVSIGPGYVVDQLLTIIDAQIDRRRALERVRLVVAKMRGKDFEKAKTYASTMITGSRQNLTLQEQKDLANQIREVQDRRISDQEKALALGFILLDFMGEDFLEEIARGMPQLDGGVYHLPGVSPTSAVSPSAGTGEASNLVPLGASPGEQDGAVPSRRDWAESRPVQRARIVIEMLTNVPLDKVQARMIELIDAGVLGSTQAERTALRLQVAEILARSGDTPQDKVYALGFAALKASDPETFRSAFGSLSLIAAELALTSANLLREARAADADEIPQRRSAAIAGVHDSAAHTGESSGAKSTPLR